MGLHGTAAAAKSGHQPTAASVAAMRVQLTKVSATVAAPARDAAAAEGKLPMSTSQGGPHGPVLSEPAAETLAQVSTTQRDLGTGQYRRVLR